MNPIRTAIALLAPHCCLVCGAEGRLLCLSCQDQLITPPSRCYRCHAATLQYQTCTACRRQTHVTRVWIASEYTGIAKQLVHKLKFERAAAAARDMADIMSSLLPLLPPEIIVTHVPTVNSRVRRRGYDQAKLLAQSIAKSKNLKHQDLLTRRTTTRQVGTSRKDRFAQLADAFAASSPNQIKGQHILLVDDVLTSGATIESAAKMLKSSGAKSVDVIVFAH